MVAGLIWNKVCDYAKSTVVSGSGDLLWNNTKDFFIVFDKAILKV
jgi:hypothetical protein